jgi:hypothetical protein
MMSATISGNLVSASSAVSVFILLVPLEQFSREPTRNAEGVPRQPQDGFRRNDSQWTRHVQLRGSE